MGLRKAVTVQIPKRPVTHINSISRSCPTLRAVSPSTAHQRTESHVVGPDEVSNYVDLCLQTITIHCIQYLRQGLPHICNIQGSRSIRQLQPKLIAEHISTSAILRDLVKSVFGQGSGPRCDLEADQCDSAIDRCPVPAHQWHLLHRSC
jgi:hypothetical protein